jgi:hypothetical protein
MKLEFNHAELITAADDRCLGKLDEFGLNIKCDEIEVRKIGMIGLHSDLNDSGKLSNPLDRNLLRTAICSVHKSPNLNLSATASAEIVNADRLHGGKDFFDLSEEYDLLVIGNIYIPENRLRMRVSDGLGDDDCYVSWRCDHVKRWPEKAEELSAKLIFTTSCGVSLDINYFEQYGNYSVLQHETRDNGKIGCAVHNGLRASL